MSVYLKLYAYLENKHNYKYTEHAVEHSRSTILKY